MDLYPLFIEASLILERRFLSMLVKIFVPYFLLTFIILMPLAAVKPNAGNDGLGRFTFGNVGKTVPHHSFSQICFGT